jgi:hypothetical protein
MKGGVGIVLVFPMTHDSVWNFLVQDRGLG